MSHGHSWLPPSGGDYPFYRPDWGHSDQKEDHLPDSSEIVIHRGQAPLAALPLHQVFTAVSWNVHKFKREGAFDDLGRLAKEADLLLLQESMAGLHFEEFFSSLGDWLWSAAISFFTDRSAPRRSTGVATGGKFHPSATLGLRSSDREPFTDTPKMILITRYKIEGREEELLVANIHGLNFVRTKKYSRQIDQLEEVLSAHSGPMIVAGDFNTHLPSRERRIQRLMDRHHLQHLQFINQRPQWLRLDHIFFRGVEPLVSKVLYDVRTSDHHPLFGAFTLNLRSFDR